MNNKDQNAIDEVMDWFDFGKVARVMESLEWGWATSAEKTPTEHEIRAEARGMLKRAIKCKCSIGTGGLVAEYREFEDGYDIKLSFVPCFWDVFVEKGEQ